MANQRKPKRSTRHSDAGYGQLFANISELLTQARRTAVRAVNGILTATYWEVGRRIVDFEQAGRERAGYGEELLDRLSIDLTRSLGRGFSATNLRQMRAFYLGWRIQQTVSAELEVRAIGEQSEPHTLDLAAIPSDIPQLATAYPLPWSHYVRLLSVENGNARRFYEAEALRGGWSVRQLDRQINSQFYERTALSKRKSAVLEKGQQARPEDKVRVEEEVRDPYLLEFLDLKDEYSESDLEEAIIRQLETFLLELGDDFAFVGRQRRLRVDNKWFQVDLTFFHRRLRCLILIDLKLGAFTHADAGQMHLYLNYAKKNWVRAEENPPVGLILCADKGHDEVRYALEGLANKVLAATYRTALPAEADLVAEIDRTRRMLELRVPSSS